MRVKGKEKDTCIQFFLEPSELLALPLVIKSPCCLLASSLPQAPASLGLGLPPSKAKAGEKLPCWARSLALSLSEPAKHRWAQVVPEQLLGGRPVARAGCGPSALTGSWQQQGVSQGDGPTEVRIIKQLQGCGEGGSTVTRGSRGSPSTAWGCRVVMAWPTSLLGEGEQAYRAEHRRTRGMGPGAHRGQHPCLPSPTPHLSLHGASQLMASLNSSPGGLSTAFRRKRPLQLTVPGSL